MKFQVYKIIAPIINAESLYNSLNPGPIKVDSDKWKYAIVKLKKEIDYIYGLLGQEADELIFEYDDEKNKKELDLYPWYETFFVIDCNRGNLYVHKYQYKPKNLNHRSTVKRLGDLISMAYFENIKELAKLMPYREGLNSAEFKEIFYNNKIMEVRFSDIRGNYIPEGTKLHNPNEPLDEIRRQSHNIYDADILSNALLEAEANKNLSKSPTARALIESGSKGEKIKYSNSSGEVVTEYIETKAYLETNEIIESDDLETKFKKFTELVKNKANKISKFKLFEDIDNILGIRDFLDDDDEV